MPVIKLYNKFQRIYIYTVYIYKRSRKRK